QAGILETEKIQAGKPVLAIDNQKSRLRILQIADRLKVSERPKFQDIFGKEQNAPWYCRLCFCGLVEVHDIANFSTARQPLKRFLAAFHFSYELRDRIIGIGVRLDRLALEVKPAGESDAVEDVLGLERNKIEDAVLLTDARREHDKT